MSDQRIRVTVDIDPAEVDVFQEAAAAAAALGAALARFENAVDRLKAQRQEGGGP